MSNQSKLFAEGSFTAKSYYDAVGKKGDGIDGLMAYVPSYDNPVNKPSWRCQGGLRRGTQQQRRRRFRGNSPSSPTRSRRPARPSLEAIRDAIASSTTDGRQARSSSNDKGQGTASPCS